MKLLFALLLLALCLVHAKDYPAADLDVHIVPKPKNLKSGDVTISIHLPSFKFTSESKHADVAAAIERFTQQIFPHVTETKPTGVVLPSVKLVVADENVELQQGVDESYTLVIPADGSEATISAKTVYGLYRGMETFAQIVVFDFVKGVYIIKSAPYNIEDAPFSSHRGLLIDSSRHFLPVQVIKKIIRSLTYAKMNVLHWHIVDEQSVPVQSKVYPKYWDSSYSRYEKYTQSEVAEIVEYARQRGVRVMVEYDVPGHAKSWCVGVPEICPAADCQTPLDPSQEATYEFLEKMFKEMTGGKSGGGLFPENFFHLGGDEVDLACWNKVPRVVDWLKKQGMSAHDAYLHIVKRAHEIVLAQGRSPVNWEEVWNNFGTKLDNHTVIQVWLNHATFAKVVNSHYRAILSNYQLWYLDFLGTSWTQFYDNKLTENIKEENYKYIMGGEVCMWAETVDTGDLFQTVWPRAAAAAERLWTNPATREADTENRMLWFRCYLTRQGIDAAPLKNKNARENPPHQDSCFIQ